MRSSSTTRTETTNGSNNNHHGSKPDGILNTNALLNAPPRGNGELVQPTPMFERLVTEEVQELKTYVRIVENQNRRLADLERVQRDLEGRLEAETVGRQQLESTLEAREREWAERLEHVEGDRDQWKRQVDVEKTKNSKLIDQVVRKDQDIHRMLQRKVRILFDKGQFLDLEFTPKHVDFSNCSLCCNALLV